MELVWKQIRAAFRDGDTQSIRSALVRLGRLEREEIPNEIVESARRFLHHVEPTVRSEAIFALGLHWRIRQIADDIAVLLDSESDWHVQLRAIGALGAIGRENPKARCASGRALARAVSNKRVPEDTRMIAYLELLYIHERIDVDEVLELEQRLPERISDFAMDWSWVSDLAETECPD